jgi:hypothetical protein
MRTLRWMIAGAVTVALAGCGADEISSAGAGGNVTINNPPPPTTPPTTNPDPTPTKVTPAAGCPTMENGQAVTDDGTITGPTGEYRVCTLPAKFTASTTLYRVPGVLYAMQDRVNVGDDLVVVPTAPAVTLSIRPGVVIFAKTGTSWLAVNRGNKIQAVGSAEQPIVFTSRDNVMGLATDDSQGQWGGVVLMGRAPITDCEAGTPGGADCYKGVEGSAQPALYGGATVADNSGTMKYVQIRYSGYVLAPDKELQSLTLAGVGSGTTIDHIQMHNSSDDGFENFGGRVKMRHLVITGADDDSIDLDVGYKGSIQYVIAVQKNSGAPDSMIELDSATSTEDQVPRTHMKLANFTFVHKSAVSGNGAAMLMRGKADATLVNGVLTSQMPCLRFNGSNILTTDALTDKIGPPKFESVVMQCAPEAFKATVSAGSSDTLSASQVEAAFKAGSNNSSTFSATLTNTFVNGANETAAVAVNPKTIDADFDEQTAPFYVGAVRDATDTWYAGWTCNSATANFGTTSTSCTSLPSLAQ